MNLDHESLTEDREAFEKVLDGYGVDMVRQMQAMGAFPTTSDVVVNTWLAGKAKKAKARE
jgi:hypothetical protein